MKLTLLMNSSEVTTKKCAFIGYLVKLAVVRAQLFDQSRPADRFGSPGFVMILSSASVTVTSKSSRAKRQLVFLLPPI